MKIKVFLVLDIDEEENILPVDESIRRVGGVVGELGC